MTIVFAWRKTSDRTAAVIATNGFAAIYFISQAAAILYPGTAFFDPQFITPDGHPLGIALQGNIEFANLALVVLATWLVLRRAARWTV